MVSSITGPQSSNILTGLPAKPTTPSGSTASFTDQLAAALEGYLASSGNGSHLEIDIQTTQSQNTGVRQFIVTVKDPGNAPAQAAAAASADAPKTGASFPGLSASALSASAPSASARSASQASAPASEPLDEASRADLVRAEINAYWSAQPEEVQKLRNVADFGERAAMAEQLSGEGYTIDRAIMVWGWDPLKTMLTRKMYGYNWVPGLNQGSVSTPGMVVTGQSPYDPDNRPAGSIAVNTDFAKGLNITNPWA